MNSQRAGRVIVGISESLAGYQALRYAVDEARRRGADLVAVRAYSYSYYGGASQLYGLLEDAARTIVMSAFVEALGGPPRDVRTRVAIREGPPAKALVEAADRLADVIVIGGSVRRAFGRWRGRTAWDCSRLAHCPVIVIPAPEMASIGSTASLARRTAEAAQALAHGRRPLGPAATAADR